MKNFLKNFGYPAVLIPVFLNSQNYSQTNRITVSGSINCTVGEKEWNGKVQSAAYSPQGDHLTAGFETDAARREITPRFVKKEIVPNLPYEDMIKGELKAGYDNDLIFFARYFPDKKKADNYETSYMLLKGDLAVDELSLASKQVKLGFDIEAGRATRNYNPLKPGERDLEKIKIGKAETSVIKFVIL